MPHLQNDVLINDAIFVLVDDFEQVADLRLPLLVVLAARLQLLQRVDYVLYPDRLFAKFKRKLTRFQKFRRDNLSL